MAADTCALWVADSVAGLQPTFLSSLNALLPLLVSAPLPHGLHCAHSSCYIAQLLCALRAWATHHLA